MDVPNPFSQSIISDAWHPPQSDVGDIHADVFDFCCDDLSALKLTGYSRSVLLHGLPGSGKTHLLARLRSHLTSGAANSHSRQILPGSPSVLFTAVRLRAGSRMLCRHLRYTLAVDLFRATGNGMSQLERVLLHRFSKFFKHPEKAAKWWSTLREPELSRPWWLRAISRPKNIKTLERQVETLIDRLDDEAQLGRNLRTALYHLALGRHRRDIRDWLRDGVLPEPVMNKLGLLAEPEDEDPEEQAVQSVCALTRLADSDIPMVLCFDQVEALQSHPQDIDGLFAFGRMISALHDKTQYTLIISCVQTAFMDTLDEVIRGADMDRLAEREGLLKPLSWFEAQQLVKARLDTVTKLTQERTSKQLGELWPLRSDRLQTYFQSSGVCTPRQLISYCDDEYESWRQGKVEPVLPIGEFLATQLRIEQERALRNHVPLQTDDTLAHGLPMALEVLDLGRSEFNLLQRHLDLILDIPIGKRNVCFCNQSGRQLTTRLKMIMDNSDQTQLMNTILIRDSRVPISRYARKARELLEELAATGVRLLRPSPQVIADFEALRTLLSDAQAGDLANHGQSVSVETVKDWLKQQLPDTVRDFLTEIAQESQANEDTKIFDELLEYLQQHRIVLLSELVQQLDYENQLVERCLNEHPQQFGILAGPPTLVYQWIPNLINPD